MSLPIKKTSASSASNIGRNGVCEICKVIPIGKEIPLAIALHANLDQISSHSDDDSEGQ